MIKTIQIIAKRYKYALLLSLSSIAFFTPASSAAVIGAVTITTTRTLTDTTITASDSNQSAILVSSGGNLSLSNTTITTSGETSSSNNSSFYGLNAGILTYTGGKISTLYNCKITTSGSGANGVFAYGTGTIDMENDTINCTGGYAHGIMCSGGGTINVKNCYAKTTRNNGSVIATDKGSGTITIAGGYYESTGSDAVGIYSTGKITASDATFKSATNAGLIIEGENTITLTNCIVEGYSRGAKLFQSMSGDAEGTTPVLTITGGTFSTTKGPLLYGTNANGTVTLDNVTISNLSDTLIYADSASKGGGTINLIAKNQTVKGTANSDKYSSFSITLQESSSWTGSANTGKTAEKASVSLDATSAWTVTAESHVTRMSDAGITGTTAPNITGNGFSVYYNPDSSSSLGGMTYTLVNGGYLLPEGSSVAVKMPLNRANEMVSEMSITTTTGRIAFDQASAGTAKKIAVYDVSGKLIKQATVKKNEIDLCKDLGISQGKYVVKTVVLP